MSSVSHRPEPIELPLRMPLRAVCQRVTLRDHRPQMHRCCTVQHGLRDEVDNMGSAAQTMMLWMDVQATAQDPDGSVIRGCVI